MAVRTPLHYDSSGHLKEMTSALIDDLKALAIYEYSLNPSVSLTVSGSGGNLTSINDTRLQAGAASTSVTAFPTEATTAEPSTVTVSYQRITKSNASITPTSDTGKTFPLYYTSGGNLRAMDATDFRDTFIFPSIDTLVLGTTTTSQGGTYFVSTSTSVAGSTLVSATPIFLDTRANTTLYTDLIVNATALTSANNGTTYIIQTVGTTDFTQLGSANNIVGTVFTKAGGTGVGTGTVSTNEIPETLDQPTTINSYYLHKIDGSAVTLSQFPVYADASNNVKQFSQAEIASLLSEYIRNTAASSTGGYQITYNIDGTGTARGSAMVNTILNGSGNYQTRFVNTDDYRAQEFPDGSPITANTYTFKINKV